MQQHNQRNRLIRLIAIGGALVAAGLAYGWFASHVAGIPCMFHVLTGLKCPGCGMTRVLVCLTQGDFQSAFRQNMAVFFLLPLAVPFAILWAVRYVRTGSKRLGKLENILLWTMVAVLLVFGILRNFLGI